VWFAVCVQQNVSRLDVSVQNAVFMCVVHGARDFRDELCSLLDRYQTATHYVVEIIAFDEPHAEVVRAVAFTDFVDWHDSRVI
jgi:acetylglutamate kinase